MRYISKEERPWGRFYILSESSKYKIKKIEVDPEKRLSYQFHKKRSETWIIIKGRATITLDDKIIIKEEQEIIEIPKNIKHRVENQQTEKLVFIEVQTGDYFGEDDIVRIQDDYNRI